MKEAVGDLWQIAADTGAIPIVTTNGFVTARGKLVMGRGSAWEAKARYPGLDVRLGSMITRHGNVPALLKFPGTDDLLITMPVKPAWHGDEQFGHPGFKCKAPKCKAQIVELIKSSTEKMLKGIQKDLADRTFVMPRPGCGNGGMDWEEVKAYLSKKLDDRFTVVTFPPIKPPRKFVASEYPAVVQFHLDLHDAKSPEFLGESQRSGYVSSKYKFKEPGKHYIHCRAYGWDFLTQNMAKSSPNTDEIRAAKASNVDMKITWMKPANASAWASFTAKIVTRRKWDSDVVDWELWALKPVERMISSGKLGPAKSV